MATYAIVVISDAMKGAFNAAAWETYADRASAAWAAAESPEGPITHWVIGDPMEQDRLNFYQFPADNPFVPSEGFPVGEYTEQQIVDARASASVFTVSAETLGPSDYQQARDLVTGMMGIVPWAPL